MEATAAKAVGSVYRAIVVAERLGGCYTCRYFGERVGVAVWCAQPGGEHVRSQANRGCAFWEREPGSDDCPWPGSDSGVG